MAANAVTEMKVQGNHSTGETVQCTWCLNRSNEVVKAGFTCQKCPANLCTTCKQLHGTILPLKHHRVVESKNSGQSKDLVNKEFCKKHHGEKNEFFCKNCEQFLCIKCTVADSSHSADYGQKHDCIEASVLAKMDREQLNKNLTKMEPLKVKLRKQIKNIEDELQRQKDLETQNGQMISKSTDTIVNEVKKKSKKLMANMKDTFIPRKHTLTEDLKLFRQQLEELCKQADKYTATWNPTNDMELHEAMLEGKDAMTIEVPDEVPSFNSVTCDMATKLSNLRTALDECMGNVIQHVVLLRPPAMKRCNDVRHSEHTSSFFTAGGSDGLWKSDGERLRKVHDEESYGLCISKDGQWLYSAAGDNKVNVFQLNPTKDLKLVRNIQVEGPPQSVCRAEDGRMAVISWGDKKIFVFNKEEKAETTIENIFNGGKPRYGAWIGGDALCVTVDMDGKADKVMSIDTVRCCILWEVNVANVWNVSYVANLLYISHNPVANWVTVLTKNGERIREMYCPTGFFSKMFANLNNRQTLTAMSYNNE